MPRELKEEDGKRYSLSAKTSLDLNLALKAAAKRAGRSVSQEIESRLEISFKEDASKEADLKANLVARAIEGDDDTASMVRSFTWAIGAVLAYAGRHWREDFYARAGVQAAINSVRQASFGRHPLDLDPDTIDRGQFDRAVSAGTFLGRSLVASHMDPAFSDYISDIASKMPPLPEAQSLMDIQTQEEEVRLDAAPRQKTA